MYVYIHSIYIIEIPGFCIMMNTTQFRGHSSFFTSKLVHCICYVYEHIYIHIYIIYICSDGVQPCEGLAPLGQGSPGTPL